MAPSLDVRALVRRAKASESGAEKLAHATKPADFFIRGFVDTRATRDDGDAASSRKLHAPSVPGLAYEREFLGAEDARELERALAATPAEWWRAGDARRVMNAGGVAPSTLFHAGDLESFPRYLIELMRIVRERGGTVVEPNHVLVNEYEARGGIQPHSDGDIYAEDVAILTLRGSALIEFWPTEGKTAPMDGEASDECPRPVASVLLEPRSLLSYRGAAYRLRHGIRAKDVDLIGEECLNARDLGLRPGDRVNRNPRGRMSVVFVSKRAASESTP